jgi:hypothetical protein
MIEQTARPQFLIGEYEQGVFGSMKDHRGAGARISRLRQ